jgi:hypothetical protein
VIYDGLDVDYSDRVPALEQLAASGSPQHRLYATAMLASWGVPSALRSIAGWARAPESAPWAGTPVTFERFSGADSAFELLADALRISQDARGRDASTDALRAEAAGALLASFDRVYTGRKLAEVFDLDRPLRAAVASEIAPAVARGMVAARAASFDLATQTASLVGALAALDDAAAAAAAERLVAEHPDATRVHNEVAYAMRFGTGPATLAVLDRLAKSPQAAVRTNANESLGLRRRS